MWQRKAEIFIRTGVSRVGSGAGLNIFLDTGIIHVVIGLIVMIILFSFVNTFLISMSIYTYFACQHVLNLHINMNCCIDLISLTWCWWVEFSCVFKDWPINSLEDLIFFKQDFFLINDSSYAWLKVNKTVPYYKIYKIICHHLLLKVILHSKETEYFVDKFKPICYKEVTQY